MKTDKKHSLFELDPSLKRLRNQWCWRVRWPDILNLSLVFGKPRLKYFREPTDSELSKDPLDLYASLRRVYIVGEWTLWILMAHLRIVRSGKVVATGVSSNRRKLAAMHVLDGQRLENAIVSEKTGATQFLFDLDTVLEVRRMKKDSADELWRINGKDRYERSVRGNGIFERHKM